MPHLMIVTLAEMPDEPLRGRIAEVGTGLLAFIIEHSRSYQHVFSTPSRDAMAWVLDLKTPAWKVAGGFQGISRTLHHDKCLLLELGTDHADRGMNVATTWLKRLQSSQD